MLPARSTFVCGKTVDDFKSDALFKSAIYWQFAVVGEALTQLRKIDPATLARISESNRIIAFRNQIIHGYAVIDDEITWRVVDSKLPVLQREVETILAGSP